MKNLTFLNERVLSFQKELEDWAKVEGYISSEENIVLKLTIFPTDINPLEVSVMDFFTPALLKSVGVKSGQVSNIRTYLQIAVGQIKQNNERCSMRDFLAHFPDPYRIRIWGLGYKSIDSVLKAIKAGGLSIEKI